MKKPCEIIKIDKYTDKIETPSLLLMNRAGNVIGPIGRFTNFNLSLVGNGLDEISFDVPKYADNIECGIWQELTDLKIVEVRNFGRYEISVSYADNAQTVKSVQGVSLETELGQIYLNDFHVNDDEATTMERTDYNSRDFDAHGNFIPTVFYDPGDPAHSLLHRVLADKAPHWSLGYITPYVILDEESKPELSSSFQRTYTADGETVYDFLTGTVAKESNVIFVFDTISRTVNCYNLCEYTIQNTKEYEGSITLTAVEQSAFIRCGNIFEITGLSNSNGSVTCHFYDANRKHLRDVPYITTSKVIDTLDAFYVRLRNSYSTGTTNTVSYKVVYPGNTILGSCIGEDTNVFLSKNKLANEITISSNKDNVKNCFRIEGGDDTITDMVRAANMNGSNYIYQFADFQFKDMSNELVQKIQEYQKDLSSEITQNAYYGDNGMEPFLNGAIKLKITSELDAALVLSVCKENKIHTNHADISSYTANPYWYIDISKPDKELCMLSQKTLPFDYANVMFDTMGIYKRLCIEYDLLEYFESSMMPTVNISKTTAEEQYRKVCSNLKDSSVAVSSLNNYNSDLFSGVTNNVIAYAKIFLDSRFDLELIDQTASYSYPDKNKTGTWSGKFKITNRSDNTDVYPMDASSVSPVKITINDDELNFAKQKIEKALSSDSMLDINFDVADMSETEMRAYFNRYSLNRLKSFYEGYNSCISILSGMGITPDSAGNNSVKSHFTNNDTTKEALYNTYFWRMKILSNQKPDANFPNPGLIDVRQRQVNEILDNIKKIENEQRKFQTDYDFRRRLGEELFLEFCRYRREDTYTNSNYISDGLTTSECIAKAKELIEAAEKEAKKACMLQRTVSTSLNNLFALPEFEPLYDKFALFNYIRIRTEDEILKLRLIGIDFNGESASEIQVTFSEQIESVDGSMSDLQSVLSQAGSIATSYPSTVLQAKQGFKAQNAVQEIYHNGLNAAKTMLANNDSNEVTITQSGILCKRMDDEGFYGEKQLRITGNGMYLTEDNWKSVAMAVGEIQVVDPTKTEGANEVNAYGIIAENIVGKMVASEKMYISNQSGSVEITGEGITIKNGIIQSANYDTEKKTGSMLDLTNGTFNYAGGKLTYKNKTLAIEGNVTANELIATNSGKIANFYISENALSTADYNSVFENNRGIYLGKNGLMIGNNFKITKDGAGFFKGGIHATALYLDEGIKIDSSYIPNLPKEINLSVENKDTSANLKLSVTKEDGSVIEASAQEIKFNGLVSFEDLSGNGTTQINGSNITTGSINANLITTGILNANRIEVTDKIVLKDTDSSPRVVARIKKSSIYCRDGLFLGGNDPDFDTFFENYVFFHKNTTFSYNIDCYKGISFAMDARPDTYNHDFRLDANGTIVGKEFMLLVSDTEYHSLGYDSKDEQIFVGSGKLPLRIRGTKISAPHAITIDSDERLKNSFKSLDGFERAYMDLKPYAFKYNNGTSNRFHFGFKAQNVRDSLLNNGFTTQDFAGFVQMSDSSGSEDYCGINDPMGLRYSEFISWNTHMIQKLYKENQSLLKRIENLEKNMIGEK